MDKDRAKQIWDRINEADEYLDALQQEHISQLERDNYGVNLILETKGCLDILRELLTDKVMVLQKCGHRTEITYCNGLDLPEVLKEFEGSECVPCRTANITARIRKSLQN